MTNMTFLDGGPVVKTPLVKKSHLEANI